jgi:hypothetical protein
VLNRTRSYTDYGPGYTAWTKELVHVKTDAGSGLCPGEIHDRTEQTVNTVFPLRYSAGTIQDYVVLPKVKHKTRRRNPLSGIPMAVKPVYHTKVSMGSFKDSEGNLSPQQGTVTIVQSLNSSNSLCNDDLTLTQTTSPLSFLCERFGADYVKEHILDALPRTNSDISFEQVEWDAMADKFDEICKSLIPSNFFSGETIAEGGIFVDAFKLVLNPKKAIVGFIKDVYKRGLHRKNLGELNHHYRHLLSKGLTADPGLSDTMRDIGFLKSVSKESISQHLGFQFGVVPAIHDIRATLDAHRKVEDQLALLNKHRGRYFPIRVKAGFPASFTPGTFTSPYLDFSSVLRNCFTVGSIFGMGKVRTDINEASRWRAYMEYFGLNKVVGTAWELIPFSFVAEWFTNSQEAINQLTRIPLGESPFMNIAAVGHSVKNIAAYDYICNPGYDLTYGYPNMEPSSQFSVFSYAVTEYTRTPGFPDTSWFANLSNLGSFQAVAGGELLIQKFL